LSVSLGPFVLSWSHLLLALTYFIALLVGWLVGRQRQVSIEPTLTAMLIAGLLMARLVFVLLYWQDYRSAPLGIIDIRDGGFSALGGLAGTFLLALYKAKRERSLRIPLAAAVGAGALVWALGGGLYSVIRAGQVVPQLNYQSLAGQQVSLEQFKGKPLVINLWATWCPPCRREMPVLMQAQQNRPDLHFVFINQGELAHTIGQYLQSEDLILTNLLLDTNQKTMRELGTAGLPSTLFYNAEGVLIHTHMGELSTASLKHTLKKIAPP